MSVVEENEHVKSSKTGSVKPARALFLLIVIIAALFASIGMAEAAGTPTQLVIFTDKKVYSDAINNPRGEETDTGQLTPGSVFGEFQMIVYAIVIDDDGNILPGDQSSNFTVLTVEDVKKLDHGVVTDTATHHTYITDNPSLLAGQVVYNSLDDNGLSYDTIAGDGIYTSLVNLPEYTKDSSAGSKAETWAIGSQLLMSNSAHLLVAVNVTFDNGVDVLTESTYVLFAQFNCHQGEDHPSNHNDDDGAATTFGACNMCHIGYDHLYNYMNFPEFPSDFGDVAHAEKLQPPAALRNIAPKASVDTHYNTTSGNAALDWTDWGTFIDQGDTSDYCYSCHYDSGSTLLDYGLLSLGTYRADTSLRPSCGVASKSLRGGAAVVECHSSTNITGTNIPLWDSPAASTTHFLLENVAVAGSHNMSGNSPTLPCAGCHLSIHAFTLPNTTSDFSINDQCTYCHTSDGPSSAPHTVSTTDCTACHKDDTGVLNAHEPTASSGGVNCTNCHDISGSAGADIDITNTDSSAHTNLNNLSQYTAGNLSNRKCWACHGNSSNSYANETNQPDGHYSTYKTPKICSDCHDNTDPASNFNAPQAVEHTQDSLIVKTAATNCSLCHNNSLTTITESDGFGLSTGGDSMNASVSHYLTTASLMTSSDCTWCHFTNTANASWGTPLDPRINFSSLHTGKVNNDCYNCHGGLTASVKLHDSGITGGGAGGQDCVDCHDGITGSKVDVDSMNNSDSIHVDLNTGGTANGRSENKMCYACHTNDSYINASGVVNNNSIPTSDHPGGFDTPKNCTLCHINTDSNINFSAPQVSEHYMSGAELQTRNYASNTNDSCISCHIENEMLQSYSGDSGTNYSNVSHYGKSRNNTALVVSGVVNCKYCHDNGSSNTFDFVDTTNRTISNHSANYPLTTPDCTLCHNEGRMHDGNLTIPTLDENLCTGCHTTRDNHNNSVSCLSCHVNSSVSRDKVHPIQYINASGIFNNSNTTAVNCTDCHQSGVTGFESAPIIPNPLRHSTNPANGTIWGSYWDDEEGSCQYCHGDTRHNLTALGNPANFQGSNTIGSDLTGTWCLGCHLNGSANYDNMLGNLSSVPPEITAGDTNYPSSGSPQDHTGYTMTTDNDCTLCHAGDTTNITTYMHNLEVGQGGGRDCISCHDIGQSTEKVDVSKMNTSTSIHNNLNNLATATNADNKRCWACHTNSSVSGDGQVDESELSDSDHPDGYNTPKNCTLCHIDNNFGALIVGEHFTGGTDIKTKSYGNTNDSCVNCHNKTEMLLSNSDPSGPKSVYASVSHYGDNKTGVSPYNTGSTSNCTYCHNNSGTAFSTEMVDSVSNTSINNHSNLGTTPGCTNSTCHDSGRIHFAALTKPTVSTSLCTNCHDTKSSHNNTIECGSCHLETNLSIHGIQYLQPDTSWGINSPANKSTAVNCTDCHQSGVTGFETAPIVNQPVNHSSNNSGQKWNTYWPTNNDSCQYCHGDSRHSTYALGTPATFQGSNTIGSDLTGTWCLGCHLNGSANYNNMLGNMSLIPPSITNNSNDPNYPGGNAVNHSSYTLTTDNDCTTCHGGSTTNISTYMHDLEPSTSCTTCHSQPPLGSSPYNTTGAHSTHNSSIFQSLYGALGQDIGCNYCHNTAGSGETGHPQNDGNADVITNGSANITDYTQNTAAGNDDTCSGVDCHNRSLPDDAVAGTGTWSTITGTCDVCHSTNATTGVPSSDAHTIHNITKGYTCDLCHSDYPTNHFNGGNATLSYSGLANSSGSFASTWTQGSQTCYVYCHDPNGVNAGGDSFAIWTNTTDRACDSCHDAPPTKTRTGDDHPSNPQCEDCHDGYTITTVNSQTHIDGTVDSTFGGKNCTSCHDVSKVDVGNMNQSNNIHLNLNSGGGTANRSEDKFCWACHTNASLASDGNVTYDELPDGTHPDSYDTPKNCTLCHINTGSSNFTAPQVQEHYSGGSELQTRSYVNVNDSCTSCHTATEMLSPYTDSTGTNYSNVSHYGITRNNTNLVTGNVVDCTYCHQNASTVFDFVDSTNTTLSNHSSYATSPSCSNSTCHQSGRMHAAPLTIPTFDNTLCTSCHDTRQNHSGTVSCLSCHVNNSDSRDKIHPVKYITPSAGFSTSNTSAVNCTDCHQSGVTGFESAPIIPDPAKHSSNLTNGSIWGTYWNTEEDSCHYCHEDTRHNNTAFGKINALLSDSNNTRSGSLSTTTWCADCHYNDSENTNYLGNQWSPQPPLITVDNTGQPNWEDHTTYLGSGYKDTNCKDCHGSAISGYTEDSLNFSHAVSEGGGGPDCVSSGCHGSTGSATSPYMNWTSLKTGMHADLNGGADTIGMTDPIVAACWACHGDGTKPGGHPTAYKQPYYCTECHLASGNITGQYSATNVSEHQHVDAQVLTSSTTAKCENCHYNSQVDYTDNETNSLTDYVVGNVSHYGANSTAGNLMEPSVNSTNCVYCHLNDSNRATWANAVNASDTKPSIHSGFNAITDSSECWSCHVDGGASTVTAGFSLHNTSLNPGASEFCLNCHTQGGSAQNVNVSSNDLGEHINLNTSAGTDILNNSDCWSCHFGYPNGTSGTHSYDVSSQNTYYCEDCHGPSKNTTAQANNIDSSSNVLADFYHGKTIADYLASAPPKFKDCGICHLANDSRTDINGNRLKIYHNQTPYGKVANTGWDGWTVGMMPSCNDCHQTKNLNDAPFHAPGKDHQVASSGGCRYNCHNMGAGIHQQLSFGDYNSKRYFGFTPPEVRSISLNSPVVEGNDVNISVFGVDNYLQIASGQYRVLNSTGAEVVGWTTMTPQNNRFKSKSETAQGTIDTTGFAAGDYTVYVRLMASGPKTDLTKRAYPSNGAWSSVSSTKFTVNP